jgi:ADP-ribosylglycohydrolase
MAVPHERPLSNIKVAFTWSLYYLKNNYSYEQALRDILSRGGETASNAAIVCAVLGAAQGIEAIP